MKAVIVGGGRFAKNYARILGQMAEEITEIVVTRRNLSAAKLTAAEFQNESLVPVHGIVVESAAQLEAILKPMDVCFVTARDRDLGDSIHAEYVAAGLKYGKVLCEKPFVNCTGDGSSLGLFAGLSEDFAIELPYDPIIKMAFTHQLFADVNFLHVYVAAKKSDNDLIDNLGPHAEALLPSCCAIHEMVVDSHNPDKISAMGNMYFHGQCRPVMVTLEYLTVGKGVAAFQINDDVYLVKADARNAHQIMKCDCGFISEAVHFPENARGTILPFSTSNPLEQHIRHMFGDTPFSGIDRALSNQIFLEKMHGYKESYSKT